MVKLSQIQSYLFLFLEHNPGLVPVQVSCDGQVVSNTVIFEYKEKQRAGISFASNSEQVKDWFTVSGKFAKTDLRYFLGEKLTIARRRFCKVAALKMYNHMIRMIGFTEFSYQSLGKEIICIPPNLTDEGGAKDLGQFPIQSAQILTACGLDNA